jgi:opacity protein-like surface antigen
LRRWAAGGSIEYAFAPNWTAKGEYQYINVGMNGPVMTGGMPMMMMRPGVTCTTM